MDRRTLHAPLAADFTSSCASLKQGWVGRLQQELLDGQAVSNEVGKQKTFTSPWQVSVFSQRGRIEHVTTHSKRVEKPSDLCLQNKKSFCSNRYKKFSQYYFCNKVTVTASASTSLKTVFLQAKSPTLSTT